MGKWLYYRSYSENGYTIDRIRKMALLLIVCPCERDRQSYLCRKHVECNFALDSCMKFRKSLPGNSGKSVTVFNFVSEAVNSTLCQKEERYNYHRLDCLTQKYKECGVQNLKLADKKSKEPVIKWKRYEYLSYQNKSGEERRKIALVNKETPVIEIF